MGCGAGAKASSKTDLFYAARSGNLELAEKVLTGSRVNNRDPLCGHAALHVAASSGNTEIVSRLLVRKANPNAQNFFGDVALHVVLPSTPEIIELLLKHKASVSIQGADKKTPLHMACRSGAGRSVQLLIIAKADPSQGDKFDDTPVHEASRQGCTDIVFDLIRNYGARVDAINKSSKTPLHVAAHWGHLDVVRTLLQIDASLQRDNRGDSALHAAAVCGHHAIVEELLVRRAPPHNNALGQTPLLCACMRGHAFVVESLLRMKSRMEESDGNGNSAYHLAAASGHVSVFDVVQKLQIPVGQIQNTAGQTAVHSASSAGRTAVLQRLVALGMHVNVTDETGSTPMHMAVLLDDAHEIIPTLISVKAIVETLNTDGRSPLAVASEKNKIITAEILLRMSANVASMSKACMSPLHYAAENGNQRLVELLLRWAASVNVSSSQGETPLEIAKKRGDADVVRLLAPHFQADGPVGASPTSPQHFQAGGPVGASPAYSRPGNRPPALSDSCSGDVVIHPLVFGGTQPGRSGHDSLVQLLSSPTGIAARSPMAASCTSSPLADKTALLSLVRPGTPALAAPT